jgi:hypothetical protein
METYRDETIAGWDCQDGTIPGWNPTGIETYQDGLMPG